MPMAPDADKRIGNNKAGMVYKQNCCNEGVTNPGLGFTMRSLVDLKPS